MRALRALLLIGVTAVAILGPSADAGAKRAPAEFLGIGPSTALTASEYQRMAKGGARLIRVQIPWHVIQPTANGPYDWSTIDTQVAGAAQNGIKVLPFFYGTPRWAANCSGVSQSLCERVLPTRSAAGETGWTAFLDAAVRRYGPMGGFWADTTDQYSPPYSPVRIWQIWNEPSSAQFSPPKPSTGLYYRLLQISNGAIKGVDPGASIMLAGMFQPVRRFLTRLYARPGARDLFDVVALHPYSATLDELGAQLLETRTVMRRAGDRATPLWITELGWGSAKRSSNLVPLQNLLLGMKGQARMLRQALNLLIAERRRYNLRKVIWFSWRDVPRGTGGRCYLCESSGLFGANGTPKPAWRAFVRLAGGTP